MALDSTWTNPISSMIDTYSAVKTHCSSLSTASKPPARAWDNPLLLPTLFLSEHLNCMNVFCTKGNVLMETFRIEQALGVTKVGQSGYFAKETMLSPQSTKGSQMQAQHMHGPTRTAPLRNARTMTREETEALTVRINTQSTRVAFTARSPQWNVACSHFILEVLHEIKQHLGPSHAASQHECKQLIEHNIILAEAAASNIAVVKERMELQLNVLYNFVAQLDNQTSAELAASASRDSTSMKILAFISALFLPGSFISELFSSRLFDWHNEFSDQVLSKRFWMYWAISIPLTLITVARWGAWWNFELGRFDQKIKSIRGKSDAKTSVKQMS